MLGKQPYQNLLFRTASHAATAALAMVIVLALTVMSPGSAQGQTFKVIHDFTGGQDGASPYSGLTMDAGGNLYGTTYSGGAGYGGVFRLKHVGSSWVFNPLYSFAGGEANDGAGPYFGALTVGPNGTLYGATLYGGGVRCGGSYSGCGTVFNLRPQVTVCKTVLCPWSETVLYRFSGGSDGAYPNGDLVFDQAGNIYGSASDFAQNPPGLIYELTPSGGAWTKSDVYSFTQGTDGAFPQSGVIFDKAGNLYGVAGSGGIQNSGTIYQLTHSGSGWTENTLYQFGGANGGNTPSATLISDASGNLFGAASNGGPNGGGTAFELSLSGGNWTYTVLYGFTGANGSGPSAKLLMDASGNLYGTTSGGGAYGKGSIFELSLVNGVWTYIALHDFQGGADGGKPYGSLIFGKNGNLYGSASEGGAHNKGVVFEITPTGAAGFNVLHNFSGATTDGGYPSANLIRDAAGTLFGTTEQGGRANAGTVFKVDASGAETVLYNFTGQVDGGTPRAGLVEDSSGNLYGTTVIGGSAWQGVVFKLDTNRSETVLHNFTNWPADGAYPYGGLVRDSSGNFYGSTQAGGSEGYGTVFKFDKNGVESLLYSFSDRDDRDGANPLYETLFMDGSLNLYGTTYAGGNLNCNAPYGCGTVFKVDQLGNETTLHIFNGGTTDGCSPLGGVAVDASGNLYGTTQSCGSAGKGTVWELSSGAETVLHNFIGGADGSNPTAGVVVDSLGNFYGVTQYGGGFGNGVLFKVDASRAETVLHSFSSSVDGANPIGGLLLGPDNTLYGTASTGGSGGHGTVWGFHLQ